MNLTIAGWYASSKNRVDEFRTEDGWTLEANHVGQLRSAMASFTPLSSCGGMAVAMPHSLDQTVGMTWAWDDGHGNK